MSKHQGNIYISLQDWARVLSEAWLDSDFKAKVEADPAVAIREKFPELEFANVYQLPPRPDHISDEELWQVIRGEKQAFPEVDFATHMF